MYVIYHVAQKVFYIYHKRKKILAELQKNMYLKYTTKY